MSFKAKLNVGGQDVNVLNLNYALKQETDATGRPSSITRGGKISLTVTEKLRILGKGFLQRIA